MIKRKKYSKMVDYDFIKFVKLYQNETLLWNRSSGDYRKPEQRFAAKMRIAASMNIYMNDVSKLTTYLRSKYRMELYKISQYSKADKSYTPEGNWFELVHSFLHGHINQIRTRRVKNLDDLSNPEFPEGLSNPELADDLSNAELTNLSNPELPDDVSNQYYDLTTPTPPLLEQLNNEGTESETEDYRTPHSEMYDGSHSESDKNKQTDLAKPTPTPTPTPPPLEPSNNEGTASETERHINQQSEMNGDTRTKRHKKKRKVDKNDILSNININSTLEKLNTISERAVSALQDDSFDCFGKYVASMLRGLPNHTALNIQGEMTSLLLKAHHHIASNNDSITRAHHHMASNNDSIRGAHHHMASNNDSITSAHHHMASNNDSITSAHHHIASNNDSITRLRNSGFNALIPQVFSSGNDIPENFPEGTCLVDL